MHRYVVTLQITGDRKPLTPPVRTAEGTLCPEEPLPCEAVLVGTQETREALPLSRGRLGCPLLSVTISTCFHNQCHFRDFTFPHRCLLHLSHWTHHILWGYRAPWLFDTGFLKRLYQRLLRRLWFYKHVSRISSCNHRETLKTRSVPAIKML